MWHKNRGSQGYFKLAKRGAIVFFWYKGKGRGGGEGHMNQQDL